LNISVFADPAFAPEVETMAQRIAGPNSDVETLELARTIAEAQIDLVRVRNCHRRLVADLLTDPDYLPLRDPVQQRDTKPQPFPR
jgi:hypothetical protein